MSFQVLLIREPVELENVCGVITYNRYELRLGPVYLRAGLTRSSDFKKRPTFTHIASGDIHPSHAHPSLPIVEVEEVAAPDTKQDTTVDSLRAVGRSDIHIGLLFKVLEEFDL